MKQSPAAVNRGSDRRSSRDGRRTRWAAHREQRHLVLIEAAIQAVLRHGSDVDMDKVAAAAGVSKPVLYRYFADKEQLWLAVGRHVAAQVVDAVTPALAQVRGERDLIAAAVDAYLAAIEERHALYRYLVHQSGVAGLEDLIVAAEQTVASGLARALGDRLRALGLDSGPAEPWAHGLVGFVRATGDWWIRSGTPMSRPALTRYMTALLCGGVDGLRRDAAGRAEKEVSA